MTWITWASKSRSPSDANLMGLESSKVDAATAAAQQSNRRIDETKLTRAISLSLSLSLSLYLSLLLRVVWGGGGVNEDAVG